MYFDSDGLPRAVVTTAGNCVTPTEPKDWQYWKFVWRSTLVNVITVVEHLHCAHFRTGGVMARAVREALPPDHGFRRLLTPFTFGTPLVNQLALHILSAPNAALDRAMPFNQEAFARINAVAMKLLHPIEDTHKEFLHQEEWDKMPD